MTSMDIGTLVQPSITDYFNMLSLGPDAATIVFRELQQDTITADVLLAEDESFLHCHECMEDGGLWIPVVYGKSSLVLPEFFLQNAGFMSSMDWAELCEKGLTKTINDMETMNSRGGPCETGTIPLSTCVSHGRIALFGDVWLIIKLIMRLSRWSFDRIKSEYLCG